MVCPICGNKSEVGLFCTPCYIQKNLTVEIADKIELNRCPSCGSYLLKGKWLSEVGGEEAVRRAILSAIKTNIKGIEKAATTKIELLKKEKEYEATITIAAEGVELEKNTIVKIRNNTCPECSRIAGGYYEAVLQLRGYIVSEDVKKIAREIESHKDKNSFVAEIRKVPGGYDMYLGSKKSAEKIAKSFKGKAEVKKSFKQVSFDRQVGKSKNRFFYLISV